MYRLEDRHAAVDHVLAMADADPRIVAGAVVGSLAFGTGDRFSDIDLTFGVDDATPVHDVIEDWTGRLADQLDAVFLFDLPAGPTIYRVFLLPGCLQMDLSFTPASQFGAGGPRFRLLFGEAHEKPPPEPPKAGDLFGWGVAYAREARACIERGRPWQAALSIAEVRNHALMLACLARWLPTRFGRGYDELPPEVLEPFEGSFVSSLDDDHLMIALAVAIEGLIAQSAMVGDAAETVALSLQALLASP
jgi:hypothetical protein